MLKNKFSLIIISIGLVFGCTVIFFALTPKQKLTLYKNLYVSYTYIFQRNLTARFNDAQLSKAIDHASHQAWVQKRLREDFTPFQDGITKQQVDHWFVTEQDEINKLVKFTVKDGKVTHTKLVSDYVYAKDAFKTTNAIITLLAKKGYIPDCEFIISLNDYLVPTGKNNTPVAILSFAKDTTIPIEQNTILVPDWMNVLYWDRLKGRIKFARKIYPWQKKRSMIHWRGGCADSLGHRNKLLALNDQLTFLDIGMTQAVANQAKFIDPEQSLLYKYQISLDVARSTWERIIWQMYSNSVMLKPRSTQIQWFHDGLVAYKNYVPINNVEKQDITNIYKWLTTHEDKVQDIIHNANEFAEENFKTQDFIAYYALVFREYGRLYQN